MPTATYPSVPDAWCETTLNPPEGDWQPAIVQELSLDTTHWAVGRASVKAYIVNYFQARIDFQLKSAFDANKQDVKLHLWLAIEDAFDPSKCRIWLTDANGNLTARIFGMQVGTWILNEFPLGPSTGWHNENFDWTKITRIGIEANCVGLKTGSFWVDELCFTWTTAIPLVRILSYDQNGQILNVTGGVIIRKPSGTQDYFSVPFSQVFNDLGTYTLVAVESTSRVLDHWIKQDGSSTSEKFIVVDVQGPVTVTMNWNVAGNNQDHEPQPFPILPVVAMGGLLFSAILIYYWS